MTVGVLALQGDFAEHLRTLCRCGVNAQEVRTVQQLQQVDGLIIPGGESTTIIKLMQRYGLDAAIRERVQEGMPLYGTCAGLIVMAREIEGYPHQPRLGLLDVAVARNAFGRQVDSFEMDLLVPRLGIPPIRAVFIRAPYVTRTGDSVEVLARIEEKVVLVQQGHLLGSAFHPELTDDLRLHLYFLDMVRRYRQQQ
ncbi:MAG: pyridoxal 5'-phosphate synthase glutaminase subunit PdxT [Armatimonadota bacterium]|nr:pyridoxal 5'-phosphate synthase glutaminase subunit PdxT [Armatimonadota bacterium]MDW8290533.1 pyridoxal 5'-phosphate synthase glutaminase subunit PdxT [Armatimonadota bacterium]